MKDCPAHKFNKDDVHKYVDLPNTDFEKVIALVGTETVPGGDYPLDPKAAAKGLKLARDPDFGGFRMNIGRKDQLEKMLAGEPFYGTIVR